MALPKDVFISYHTKSAAETVLEISKSLENAGISCWYAPRDVQFGDYAVSIMDAIKHCRLFLLILNEEANHSGDVLNEVQSACSRYKRHEDIAILPVRIDDCTLSDAMSYRIGRIHIVNGGNPLDVETLTNRIKGI